MTLLLLALLGCTSKEDAAAALSATPGSVDLGTVAVGASAEATVVLRNEGGGSVEILSASLVEGDARAWSVARDGFEALAGDVTTVLTLTFAPDDEGASPAELQVRSTDPTNPSLYVTLDAIGGPSTADEDGDGVSPADGDCDDRDGAIFPGAEEACDGEDSDCDGVIPTDEADSDGDGWRLCDADCDDDDRGVFPGAVEICDDKDTDCDGVTPDRADADADGYTLCDADCDDAEPAAFPGGVEVCDGVDNDCSGGADDLDADGDGASLCGAVPDCDDDDATAYPLYVDAAAEPGGTGTEAAPLATIAEALGALDTICRTVGLASGTYAEALTWDDRGEVSLVGLGGDPSGTTLTAPEDARILAVTDGRVTLENLSLVGARNPDGDGGAVLVTDAALVLRGVVASLNTTAADGGAVAVSSGALALEDGCVFSGNTAGDDGGAVALVSSSLTDDGTTYTGNRAIQGGGLFAVSSNLEIDASTFEENTASGDGGGLAVDAPSVFDVERVVFVGNAATGTGGGAALNDVYVDGRFRNGRFLDNSAAEGGGVAFTGSYAWLMFSNNTLVGNTSTGDGAAVLVESTAAANLGIYANLFAWNVGGSGLYVAEDAWPMLYKNLGYATSSGTDFAISDEYVGIESIVADPLFWDFSDNGDPYDDDLTLGPGSPAIDSGPLDGEGPEGHWTWSDVDGSQNDRGYTGGPGGW